MMEKVSGNINKLDEDSKIIHFADLKLERDEKVSEEYAIDYVYIVEGKYFIFPKETKREICNKIAEARSTMMTSPYIILVPRSRFKKNAIILPYPISFIGETIYIVPWIRDILIYEKN